MKNLVTILLVFFALSLSAQDDGYVYGDTPAKAKNEKKKGFDWNRVTVGGGLFLQFGTNSYIAVSPTLGYYLTDNLIAGFGGSYVYEETNSVLFPYTATTYSGMAYAQYIFEDLPILLHTEIEKATVKVNYLDLTDDFVIDMVNVYVGGGLKQNMGGNSYLYALGLWNLNETKESNYIQTNPIIRIGFAIGL